MKRFNAKLWPALCMGCILLVSACHKELQPAPRTQDDNGTTPVVTTFAGNNTSGAIGGMTDGVGTAATFYQPFGITTDAQGNLYIADTELGLIRKITPAGVVTTLAGQGTSGYKDGTGTAAAFELPYGIVADANGNLFVTDTYNSVIRKVTPAGVVTTFAGNPAGGGKSTYVDGNGAAATFEFPWGIAIDANGNLFVADRNAIRKITPDGTVTTLAGSAAKGSANGTGTSASFNYLTGISVDSQGNIFVNDQGNFMVRKITQEGVVSTFAGSGTKGSADGVGPAADFDTIAGLTTDTHGNLFVTDNSLVRKITSTGEVTTIAGNHTGLLEDLDGKGTAATFFRPQGITADATGNLFLVDTYNDLVRKITF